MFIYMFQGHTSALGSVMHGRSMYRGAGNQPSPVDVYRLANSQGLDLLAASSFVLI
jgi:hypothetical protein